MDLLPDEILENIFDFLPVLTLRMLLKSSLNTRYYDIIAGSSRLMQKLTVELCSTSFTHCGFDERIVRSLWTYGTIPQEEMRKYSKTHKLVVTDTTKEHFQRIVNKFSEISIIEIKSSDFSRDMECPDENIVLENKVLEDVDIRYVDAPYFTSNLQIKKLAISYYPHNSPSMPVTDMSLNLLVDQTLLTSLTIRHCNCYLQNEVGKIFNTDVSEILKFRLKHFEMNYFNLKNDSIDNIGKFIKKQTELQSLSLNGAINANLWQAIVELPSLTKLELTPQCFKDFRFRDILTINHKVTELTISGKIRGIVFDKILRQFPNVSKFVQKAWFITYQDHLKAISEFLPNLQSLYVRIFEGGVTFNEHTFKELKSLTIDAFNLNNTDDVYWNNFVRMFSGIERLSIKQGIPGRPFPFDVMLIFLKGFKNLKLLELGNNFVDDVTLQIIR